MSAGAGRSSWARAPGCWSMLGLLPLHSIPGPYFLNTLHQLVSNLVLLCLTKLIHPFLTPLSALMCVPSAPAWWQLLARGMLAAQSAGVSKCWLLCSLQMGATPSSHSTCIQLPSPDVAQLWVDSAHLRVCCSGTRLPEDCVFGVHPVVLAAHRTSVASAGTSISRTVHVMGHSSGPSPAW